MQERLWWDYRLLILICTLGFGATVSLTQQKCGEPLKRTVLYCYLFPASCSQHLLTSACLFKIAWMPAVIFAPSAHGSAQLVINFRNTKSSSPSAQQSISPSPPRSWFCLPRTHGLEGRCSGRGDRGFGKGLMSSQSHSTRVRWQGQTSQLCAWGRWSLFCSGISQEHSWSLGCNYIQINTLTLGHRGPLKITLGCRTGGRSLVVSQGDRECLWQHQA